jgi:hypothetical protein
MEFFQPDDARATDVGISGGWELLQVGAGENVYKVLCCNYEHFIFWKPR